MTLPAWVAPQLATLVATPPEGDDWVHEVKLDGYRILLRIERGEGSAARW
jgi:bifunctional non-homologous end joining protein LigD